MLKYLDAAADLCVMPDTLLRATQRYTVLMLVIFVVVLLDNYFGSAAPAAAFGYALGSLTVYGTMRRPR